MNKAELVEAAAKEAGLTQIDTARALNAIMDTIIKTVAKREEITLVGFGSFKSYERAARTGQNPRTREPIEIVEYRFGKKKEKSTNGILTLRKVKGNELCELFIYLKHDEKMCLSLHIN